MNANVPDIPRIFTAIAEWGSCLLYIMLMRRKIRGWKLITLVIGALVFQTAFLTVTDNFPIFLWIPCMVFAILLMFLFIYLSCNISVNDAIYYCVRAFVLAEFAASFESQVYWFFWPDDSAPLPIKIIMLVGVYLASGIIMWLLEKRNMQRTWRLAINRNELWSTVIIGVTIFFLGNISFISKNTPFSSYYPREIQNIRTLFNLGGLAILYAHHIQCFQTRYQRELMAMQYILQNQYSQYKLSRESIELINRKYHDLKYQINALRNEQDPDKRNAWLDTMENDIKVYEALNKTGNSILDTILTSRSLYCQKHGINLNCVANGALLEFVDVMDICSLFGNALDNAIECEKKIPDKAKRLIHMTVTKIKNFLLIRIENYYEGQLFFEEDLPVTTKENIDFHGYGLKNIKSIVKKYNGSMTISAENNWFELKVLIPIQ